MSSQLHLVYDGDCAFCVRSLRLLRGFDVRHRFELWDANDRGRVLSAFPTLAGADFERAMFAVSGEGKTYRGFFAFRRAIWESPLLVPLIVLFYFPGASLIGPRIYDWVARHRHRLGCDSDRCELPPR